MFGPARGDELYDESDNRGCVNTRRGTVPFLPATRTAGGPR